MHIELRQINIASNLKAYFLINWKYNSPRQEMLVNCNQWGDITEYNMYRVWYTNFIVLLCTLYFFFVFVVALIIGGVGLLGFPEHGEIGFSNLNSQWLVGSTTLIDSWAFILTFVTFWGTFCHLGVKDMLRNS